MGRRDDDEGVSPRARARLRGAVPLAGDAPSVGVPSGTGPPGAEPLGAEPPGAGPAGYVARPEDLVAHVRTLAAVGGAAPDGRGGTEAFARDDASPGRHRRVQPPRPGWVRLPTSFVGARWQPGRAGVVGVVAVALLAVLLFGVRVAWARSSAETDVVAPGGGARAGPVGITAGAAPVGLPGAAGASVAPGGGPTAGEQPGAAVDGAAGSGGTAAGAVVVVHVVGEVRDPGLQRLPAGSRVSDAVAAAGGATRGADLAAVNLARLVVDGEQVRVPAPGEVVVASGGAPDGAAPGGGVDAGPGGVGGSVSLNTADPATLETLPGVGPVLAQRIVEWRTAHGGFTSVDELTEVSGIGEKTFEQLRPLVTT